jgi:predicted RNase H-like HicB family nuclease
MKYTVVIEKTDLSFGAYVPDLPGCVAVAESLEEVEKLIKESIEFHIDGLKLEGQEVPEPKTTSLLVEV